MSEFIEVTTTEGRRIIVNVDRLDSVTQPSDGEKVSLEFTQGPNLEIEETYDHIASALATKRAP